MQELKFDQNNYRIHNDKNKRVIRKSLEDCGAGRSVLVDKDNVLIAGNGVYEQAQALGLKVRFVESDGKELIVVKRTDLSSDDEKRKLLALADNYSTDLSVFDIEAILNDFSSDDLDAWEFELTDFNFTDELPNDKSNRAGSLKERFIIPPFSVLDSKQGVWQNRKQAWLDLGIKSELGRDKEITYSMSSQPPRVYEIRNQLREKNGVDPSWDELIDYCRKHNVPVMEGTSIFDPVMCELAYRWFNVPGGRVLDPFAGGSVRGIVATKLNMSYYGVDLRQEQIEANYMNYQDLITVLGETKDTPMWTIGDSLNIDKLFPDFETDLIFSCPPYADLEVYSDDPRDLSNMDYLKFIEVYREIIRKSCAMLRENRFAVFVVGEVRDKNGIYRNFISDTIKAFQDAGLQYYNEMILVTTIGSLAIRVTKQFNVGRKIGKHHQNVLVFYKGDPKQIRENFPELDFTDDDFLIV